MKKILILGFLVSVVLVSLCWGATQDFKGTVNGNTITVGSGTVTMSAGKTLTMTQNTSLDEAVAMSSKATVVGPTAWVPVLGDAATGGNLASFLDQTGAYIKIGRLVFVHFNLVNINTAGMTAGNTLYIQNLPYASRNITNALWTGSMTQSEVAATTGSVVPVIIFNQIYMVFVNQVTSGTGTNLIVSNLTSGTADLRGSIVYLTN